MITSIKDKNKINLIVDKSKHLMGYTYLQPASNILFMNFKVYSHILADEPVTKDGIKRLFTDKCKNDAYISLPLLLLMLEDSLNNDGLYVITGKEDTFIGISETLNSIYVMVPPPHTTELLCDHIRKGSLSGMEQDIFDDTVHSLYNRISSAIQEIKGYKQSKQKYNPIINYFKSL